ncbi:Uncharacterised protein [Klebsiella pneumoniae]|nr:Uncharacterised protein [Klebsiella pneumoniae]
MKIVVISDNFFFRNAFATTIKSSKTVMSEDAFIVSSKSYDGAIVIISIANKDVMLKILGEVMKMNVLKIFLEPLHWPSRVNVFKMHNVYIVPYRMKLNQFIETIESCMLALASVISINPEKIRGSEWSTMLYLMSGISNRQLAYMLKTSEKTLSGRVNNLAIKLGLVGFNKALQLRAMNLFYLIYTLNKPAEKRNYFMKQQKAILESVKKWFAIV